MKFQKLLKKVKALNLPEDKFAIFGSGPLAVRKMRDSHDIDLIVKPDLWEDLLKKHSLTEKRKGVVNIGEIEIYKDWKPWFEDVEKLIDDADIFEGVRFVKLKYLLKWKKLFNREKDKKDVDLIENFIKNDE